MGADVPAGRIAGQPVTGPLFWRVVAALPLLAGANLWTTHHLGVGLENPGGLAATVTGLGGAVRLLDRSLEKEDAETGWRALRGLLHRALWHVTAPAALAVLYLAAGAFALTFSTVLVARDGVDTRARVTVARLTAAGASPGAPSDAPLARFHVRTTPLGQPFRLTVEGYVPATVTVYPVVGLTVRPERDLRRVPSLLVRLPPEGERALGSGGRLIVRRPGGEEVARVEEPGAAFFIGRAHPISPARVGDWRLELEAVGAKANEIPKRVIAWKTPKSVTPRIPLEPDVVLRVEVWSRVGKLVTAADVPLGASDFVDVALNAPEEEGP